jgi:hypothetical protein
VLCQSERHISNSEHENKNFQVKNKERNLSLKDTKTRAKVMRPEINCIAANTINHKLRSLTPLHAPHFVTPTKELKNEKVHDYVLCHHNSKSSKRFVFWFIRRQT